MLDNVSGLTAKVSECLYRGDKSMTTLVRGLLQLPHFLVSMSNYRLGRRTSRLHQAYSLPLSTGGAGDGMTASEM